MIGDRHGPEGRGSDAEDLGHNEQWRSDRHAGAELAHNAAEHGEGVATGDDCRDDPARARREVVVGCVVDPLVLDHDHTLDLEHLQDHSLPDEKARKRDDERRDADQSNDRALSPANEGAQTYRDRDRDDSRVRVAATRQLELGDREGRYAAEISDRKVDLAEQEDEDHAERKHRQAGHLDDDVVEVVRSEEVRRLVAEEDDDQRQADDDGQDA